ncbi:MAG: hypothetical protein J6W74_00095 [Bacteroidales bacterium]|nr:hypothetical protein [Bacteroidales bacterium]
MPADFWLAWEYHLKERNRSDELMMEMVRCATARILGPFVKGGIQDVRKFWPMPFDGRGESSEPIVEEKLEISVDNLKLIADKWLKG